GKHHAATAPLDRHFNDQVRRRQAACPALGPLDEPECGLVGVQPEELEFAGVADAVQVQVPRLPTVGQRVSLYHWVSGTADGSAPAERPQQRPRKGGLARPEVALEDDDGQRRPRTGEHLPALGRVRAVGEPEGLHAVACGLAKRRNQGMRSAGSNPRSPPSPAAASPAQAWSNAPHAAASAASSPCACNPAMVPASTSPIPPTAIPGLPALIRLAPRPVAPTSVPAPLSTTTAA